MSKSNSLALMGSGGPGGVSAANAALQKLIKGSDRSALAMSDDNVMMKQVLETHSPDAIEVDVRPLLFLVEDIINRATRGLDITPKVTFTTFKELTFLFYLVCR